MNLKRCFSLDIITAIVGIVLTILWPLVSLPTFVKVLAIVCDCSAVLDLIALLCAVRSTKLLEPYPTSYNYDESDLEMEDECF